MEIRFIDRNDSLTGISNIYEQSWKYAYKGIVPQSYLDSIPSGHWADRITKAEMKNLVMLENDLLIGTASICRSRWEQYKEYGEIVSIYLLPDYIGQGFGRLLLERCVAELEKQGYKHILLWVLEDNLRARRFYENNGFLCTQERLCVDIAGKELQELMYLYECTDR